MLLRSFHIIIKVKTCPFKLFKVSREIGDLSSHCWLWAYRSIFFSFCFSRPPLFLTNLGLWEHILNALGNTVYLNYFKYLDWQMGLWRLRIKWSSFCEIQKKYICMHLFFFLRLWSLPAASATLHKTGKRQTLWFAASWHGDKWAIAEVVCLEWSVQRLVQTSVLNPIFISLLYSVIVLYPQIIWWPDCQVCFVTNSVITIGMNALWIYKAYFVNTSFIFFKKINFILLFQDWFRSCKYWVHHFLSI